MFGIDAQVNMAADTYGKTGPVRKARWLTVAFLVAATAILTGAVATWAQHDDQLASTPDRMALAATTNQRSNDVQPSSSDANGLSLGGLMALWSSGRSALSEAPEEAGSQSPALLDEEALEAKKRQVMHDRIKRFKESREAQGNTSGINSPAIAYDAGRSAPAPEKTGDKAGLRAGDALASLSISPQTGRNSSGDAIERAQLKQALREKMASRINRFKEGREFKAASPSPFAASQTETVVPPTVQHQGRPGDNPVVRRGDMAPKRAGDQG